MTEHGCNIISKSLQYFKGKKHLKIVTFLTLASILCSRAEPFSVISVEGHTVNISVVFLQNPFSGLSEKVF